MRRGVLVSQQLPTDAIPQASVAHYPETKPISCKVNLKSCSSAIVLFLAATGSPTQAGPEQRSESDRTTTTTSTSEFSRRDYYAAVERLDSLRRKLEEWGSVTASAPIIFREGGQFNLDRELAYDSKAGEVSQKGTLYRSTQQHIDDASSLVSGRAIQDTRTGFGNSMNLEVTPLVRFGMPKAKAAAAPEARSEADAQPHLPLPEPPKDTELTPPDFSLFGQIKADATASNDSVDANLFGKTADKPQGDLSLTSQQSVILGTNSKLTELIMRNMADPPKRQFTNPGKTVHMAIVQVSCNPGWRTRENYVAEITASCEYYNSTTHQVASETEGRRPVVFSVLPLIDAQTLELQSSQRQIIDLVTQISAAIPTQAANFRLKDVMKFVRDYKSTVATKTPKTISNSYSTGNQFGFRFMPSLVALKDPAEKGSPSANVLQSTVLPVLVTVVVDQGWVSNNGFDSVMVHISNRWMINDRPPLRTFWKRFARPMERETTLDRSRIAQDVRVTRESLESVFGSVSARPHISPAVASEYLMLRRDLNELSAKVLGSSHVVFAFSEPPGRNDPGHPVIRSVEPRTIPTSHPTRLAIWGDFLSSDCAVYVGGAKATDVMVARGGRQLVCTINVPDAAVERTGSATVIVESAGSFDSYGEVRLFKPQTVTVVEK